MSKNTDWQVENLRITAFPENNASVSVSALWKQYIGKKPDETRTQRGQLDARGIEYKNGRIFLIEQPGRIEWRYLTKPDDDSLEFPIIGSLERELNVIADLSKEWLNSSDMFRLNRLAFGAVLLNPVESLHSGYENLREFLPFLNLDNLSDFNYQVNRRRDSKIVEGLPINRLTRWNVFDLRQLVLTHARQTLVNIADLDFASRLELDINTSSERINSLPSEKLASLFDELVKMGLELSKKGDIE